MLASSKCICFYKHKSNPFGAHQRSYGFVPFFHPTKQVSTWEAVERNHKGNFLSKTKLFKIILEDSNSHFKGWLSRAHFGYQSFSASASSRASFQVKI